MVKFEGQHDDWVERHDSTYCRQCAHRFVVTPLTITRISNPRADLDVGYAVKEWKLFPNG